MSLPHCNTLDSCYQDLLQGFGHSLMTGLPVFTTDLCVEGGCLLHVRLDHLAENTPMSSQLIQNEIQFVQFFTWPFIMRPITSKFVPCQLSSSPQHASLGDFLSFLKHAGYIPTPELAPLFECFSWETQAYSLTSFWSLLRYYLIRGLRGFLHTLHEAVLPPPAVCLSCLLCAHNTH